MKPAAAPGDQEKREIGRAVAGVLARCQKAAGSSWRPLRWMTQSSYVLAVSATVDVSERSGMVSGDSLGVWQVERAASDRVSGDLCLAAVDQGTLLAHPSLEATDLPRLRGSHDIVGVRATPHTRELGAGKPVAPRVQRTRHLQLGERHRLEASMAPAVGGVSESVMGVPPGIVRVRRSRWLSMKLSVVVGSSVRGISVTLGVVMTSSCGNRPVGSSLRAKGALRSYGGVGAVPIAMSRRPARGPRCGPA